MPGSLGTSPLPAGQSIRVLIRLFRHVRLATPRDQQTVLEQIHSDEQLVLSNPANTHIDSSIDLGGERENCVTVDDCSLGFGFLFFSFSCSCSETHDASFSVQRSSCAPPHTARHIINRTRHPIRYHRRMIIAISTRPQPVPRSAAVCGCGIVSIFR